MIFRIFGVIVLVVLLAVIFLEVSCFRYAIYRYGVKVPDDEHRCTGSLKKFQSIIFEGRDWVNDQSPEQVSITSNDGLRLKGWLLRAKNPKRTVLCVHGFRGQGVFDFGAVCRFYYEQDCNLLIIDQRAHGASEGKFITFGIKERYDVARWISFLNEKLGDKLPVILDGVSMGAATVLMVSGLDLPSNVTGIIADCGYTSPREIYAHVAKEYYHLPAFPLVPIFGLLCRIVAGFNINETNTKEALAKNSRPVLFVHGESDRFVPSYMSRENYEACIADRYIETVPGAGHGQSYLIQMEHCQAKIKEFFDRCK
ncbi:alpha/beta hydrolase [Anaerosporobacter sp.]